MDERTPCQTREKRTRSFRFGICVLCFVASFSLLFSLLLIASLPFRLDTLTISSTTTRSCLSFCATASTIWAIRIAHPTTVCTAVPLSWRSFATLPTCGTLPTTTRGATSPARELKAICTACTLRASAFHLHLSTLAARRTTLLQVRAAQKHTSI